MFKVIDEESYKEFISYLISIKDDKYKNFSKSIVLNSKYEMIGIRTPIMKDIAEKINDIELFLKYSKNKYYEEIMIQGLVISRIKDENLFYKYFTKHIKKIDNWALCDTFCSSIKIVRKYESKYFNEAISMALSEEEFISRVGLIMILNHFINDNNINIIFDTLNKITSDKFYINMAESWLICELYIKYPNETLEFIKSNNLNKFTHNKAISKIHDSYRVSDKDKKILSSYRR